MTSDERKVARERIGKWPREDLKALVEMTPAEVELIGEGVALLDLRPCHDPPAPGHGVIEIP